MSIQRRTFGSLLFLMLLIAILNVSLSYAQFKINRVEIDQLSFEPQQGKISYRPIARYNRVQGPFFGIEVTNYSKRLCNLQLIGQLGYGFNDTWRYRAGFQKNVFRLNPLTIGVTYYDQIFTPDDWFIGFVENSAAAFFLKEDFMDYHARKGVLAFIDQKINEVHTLRLEVDNYRIGSLARQTNWALFGKNKKFRENPAVVEEKVTSVRLMCVLDWRDNPLIPMHGWYIEGKGEQTFGDSVDTQGLFLTIKHYHQIFRTHLIKLKFMLGTRSGCDRYYDQYLMDLGGIGSLLAFKDKEFKNGNRFFYATFRYLFNQSVLQRLPFGFIPFYDQLSLAIFAETGWLEYADKNADLYDGFRTMNTSSMKSDVGWSLYVTEGLIRIDFAKRTDRSKDAWRVTFRIMQQF